MHKGLDYARCVMARANNQTDPGAALAWIASRWGRESKAFMVTKAAIGGLEEGDLPDAITLRNARTEFFDSVRGLTVLGRLPNQREVPFNVPLVAMSAGGHGYWVGQSKPVPLSKPVVDGSALESRKCAGLVAMSKEVLKSDDPRTERLFLHDLRRACAGILDQALLDATNAGSDNIPKSPLYGVSAIASSGDIRADLAALVEGFEGDLATAALITDPRVGMELALSGPAFADAGPRGGIAAGLPLLTSSFSPRDGSPTTGQLVLLDAAALAVAMEDVDVTMSDQATLIMSDDPENDGAPRRVNLFQTDTVAFKVVMRANWELQHASALQYLDGVDYSA